jgi:hypothetical protein
LCSQMVAMVVSPSPDVWLGYIYHCPFMAFQAWMAASFAGIRWEHGGSVWTIEVYREVFHHWRFYC